MLPCHLGNGWVSQSGLRMLAQIGTVKDSACVGTNQNADWLPSRCCVKSAEMGAVGKR